VVDTSPVGAAGGAGGADGAGVDPEQDSSAAVLASAMQ
jgi:hypothetical protein